jgi:hypothetical protein
MKKLRAILILLFIPLLLLDMLTTPVRSVRANDWACCMEASAENEAEMVSDIAELPEEKEDSFLHGHFTGLGIHEYAPAGRAGRLGLTLYAPSSLLAFGWTVPLRI